PLPGLAQAVVARRPDAAAALLPPKPAAPTSCPDGWATSVVYRGQTCYMIAKMHDVELDELLSVNKGVNCDLLQIGETICVPKTE
ncbi:hypothetical protein MAPG_07806, partial [Magnaporthiopsis poae ATCC 64411]